MRRIERDRFGIAERRGAAPALIAILSGEISALSPDSACDLTRYRRSDETVNGVSYSSTRALNSSATYKLSLKSTAIPNGNDNVAAVGVPSIES
jgi:hypothetical protein